MSSLNSTQSPVLGRRPEPSKARQDSGSPIMAQRRARRLVSSDSDDDDRQNPGPVNNDGQNPDPIAGPNSNGQVQAAPIDPELVEEHMEFLQDAFPKKDIMDLQDALARSGWKLEATVTALTQDEDGTIRSAAGDGAEEQCGSPQPPAIKRRRLVVCRDSSDDEPAPPISEVQRKRTVGAPTAPHRSRTGAAKRRERAYSDEDEPDFHQQRQVYFSESDDDDEEVGGQPRGGPGLNALRDRVLLFLNTATIEELVCMSGCSKKKAEVIISQRQFSNWDHAVSCLKTVKSLSTELLNAACEVLRMRATLDGLLQQCQRIADRLKARVQALMEQTDTVDVIGKQPVILNPKYQLSHYQLIGLSWMVLMYKEKINAILADEMGLGKTIQAIAFLAYLKLLQPGWKYLIVVPSSTLDNWLHELSVWCPDLLVVAYRGSLDERRAVRIGIHHNELPWDVIVTTYNLVSGSPEDKGLFKTLSFKYIVFDEAHMLKNMASKRYLNLVKLKGEHRLLLTGTPLQNNLLELASLLLFVMPDVFASARGSLSTIFEVLPKSAGESRSRFEAARIEEARHIMAPFFLRRLKQDVLKNLPGKTERIERVRMSPSQARRYRTLSDKLIQQAADKLRGDWSRERGQSAIGDIMQLRKLTNHPLLLRHLYTDEQLQQIARDFVAIENHEHKEVKLVTEDLSYMSDFEIHTTCKNFQSLQRYRLQPCDILDSGKFAALDRVLPELQQQGHRVLMFSQFVIMLDVMEEYMQIRGHKYCRLDGQTAVAERQVLINQYNSDSDIFVFLLSTRAGGLGINLTAADRVIIHDVDYNPQNDRQAEDRCHRIGQTREVEIIRLICSDTIDECMLKIAQDKLKLEKDLSSSNGTRTGGESEDRPEDVKTLLEMVISSADST